MVKMIRAIKAYDYSNIVLVLCAIALVLLAGIDVLNILGYFK
jgi:preprotein translocase subunit SecE